MSRGLLAEMLAGAPVEPSRPRRRRTMEDVVDHAAAEEQSRKRT